MPPFRHRLRVRYGETDQMGVVHHATYLLYFEEGRTGLMRALGRSYADLERSGVVLPVAELGIRFRTPARYDEELIVETRVGLLTGVRVRFDYRVLHADGTLAAEGFTLLASTGKDGRPRRFPEEVSALLAGGMEDGTEVASGGVQGGPGDGAGSPGR